MGRLIMFVLSCVCFTIGLDAFQKGTDDLAALHHRSKRAAGCRDKYASITTGHSACIQASRDVLESGVSEAEKRMIVDYHNKIRRAVWPSASNMMKISLTKTGQWKWTSGNYLYVLSETNNMKGIMTGILLSWNDEIANTAQRWADHCITNHDEGYKRYAFGKFSVGQNLAWGTGLVWNRAMELWAEEVQLFTYGSTRNQLKQVGHYTQMVWAETTKIGCGYANCNGMHYYVCNYAPAGNFDINLPYKSGSSCSQCQSKCDNKLCDCNGRICLNGGKMDLNTCECTCLNQLEFYIQPDCELNCTAIRDPWQCPSYGKRGCEIYSNVPQECPSMCKWCPTAGYKYDKPTSGSDKFRPHWLSGMLAIVTAVMINVMFI